MAHGLQNIFNVPELKRKLGFTFLIVVVYRIGSHITTPGIDVSRLVEWFGQQQNTFFGLMDMFVGGGLSRATIFALGIMPYISASIIFQLLPPVFPYFEKLQKEGEEGRKKITQYTRYATVVLSFIQSVAIATWLQSLGAVTAQNLWLFRVTTMVTLTTGAVLVMWLGEQITERGIGNGMSLLIFFGIVDRFPSAVFQSLEMLRNNVIGIIPMLLVLVVMIAVVAGVIVMTLGTRKIPIQIPKRMVGRKVMGGQQTHLPLRINSAGVMPIIFAQSIIVVPATLSSFLAPGSWLEDIGNYFQPSTNSYVFFYCILIVFFTYFYTAVIFNPVDLAENFKRQGGFIPGIRPGARTAEYIDKVLTRITLPGSFFLAAIAILPIYMYRMLNVPFYFGGTSLLIVVGVALDTIQQMESHLLMRHYDGFMKKSRIPGRRMM
ncbi:MAG: preprotein translocase subunit SecY [Candidatus Glassbacteria bacterium RIFCSPLOWO2_12_FULL_58_11]|uniref:Protein translocase subunit SecY n=1 Tax=Candidatus Glassbacteria bacterium RIFCSPLOWO2_12_FULL_58_11 TaxID=1817867 RepID=A0A1F5YP38_9BACT|nr:MAG: preprotein translocase subunit SecY [Candidatus Glassbacteria bacterium RIFCSPLOWO2_12_FULL_58_11]